MKIFWPEKPPEGGQALRDGKSPYGGKEGGSDKKGEKGFLV